MGNSPASGKVLEMLGGSYGELCSLQNSHAEVFVPLGWAIIQSDVSSKEEIWTYKKTSGMGTHRRKAM